MPGLDGFRGAAVIAVLLFHGGFGWARGGFLGVTSFFVLSGFLITSLLLLERQATGGINLKAFWSRRARRLVPAALVTIALVIAYVAVVDPGAAGRVVGDGVASAAWVANWRLILSGQSYADLFSEPSPFQHMWSLAIEEQFYLLLPLAAVVLARRQFAAAVVAGVAASTAAAWVVGATARGYYGTDTRVAEPLVGVLLALVLLGPRGVRRLRRPGVIVADMLAVAGVVGLVLLMTQLDDRSGVLYRGGFLGAALLSAFVVLAATQPAGVVSKVLSAPPLVAIGRLSYGIYLFHWPVFLWLSPARTGLPPLSLFALRCGVTTALAAVSYVLVERPVRLSRLPRLVGPVAWANASVGLLAGLVLVAGIAPSASTSSFLASGPAGEEAPPLPDVVPDTATSSTTESTAAAGTVDAAPGTTASTSRATGAARPKTTNTTRRGSDPAPPPGNVLGGPPHKATPPPPPPKAPDGEAPRPTRLKVAVMGDSLALNLGDGLKAWADEQGDVAVYNLALSGCPISRGGTRWVERPDDFRVQAVCGWWDDPEHDRWKALVEFDPDIVVMQDGMNAIWKRWQDSWGDYRALGDVRFDQWMVGQYRAAASRIQSLGAVALFLNAACVDWKNLRGRFESYRDGLGEWMVNHMNQITSPLSAWMWTGDLHQHLCPNGQFTNEVDGVQNARPDKFHLSPAAAKAVAATWLGPMVLQAAPPPPPQSEPESQPQH